MLTFLGFRLCTSALVALPWSSWLAARTIRGRLESGERHNDLIDLMIDCINDTSDSSSDRSISSDSVLTGVSEAGDQVCHIKWGYLNKKKKRKIVIWKMTEENNSLVVFIRPISCFFFSFKYLITVMMRICRLIESECLYYLSLRSSVILKLKLYLFLNARLSNYIYMYIYWTSFLTSLPIPSCIPCNSRQFGTCLFSSYWIKLKYKNLQKGPWGRCDVTDGPKERDGVREWVNQKLCEKWWPGGLRWCPFS